MSSTTRFRFLAAAAALAAVTACADTAPKRDAVDRCIDDAVKSAVPTTDAAPSILTVCDDGGLAVVFAALDGGDPLTLEAGTVRAVLAKSIPAGDGSERNVWQAYTNRLEAPGEGDWPLTAPAVQATADGDGELIDLGGGLYAYRLAVNPHNVTSPLAVTYEPERIHRVGLEFRGDDLDPALGNPVYTWVPADGPTPVTAAGRAIATEASCNECHGALRLHGGPRTQVQYCALCHNPGSVDANSGHSVDMATMTHKIHMGEHLPSVQAGESYTIWGFSNGAHDYSEVLYPQDQRNCLKCHNSADEATPDGDAWKTQPSIAACGACHDNVRFDLLKTDFETGNYPDWQTWHTAGPQPDSSNCSSCHEAGGEHGADVVHRTAFATPNNPELLEGAVTIEYILDEVALNAGTQPTATFRILVDGEPLDMHNIPDYLNLGFLPQLSVAYAAPEHGVDDPDDFNNLGNGNAMAQPAGTSLAFVTGALIANDDGSFSTPPGLLADVPEDATRVAVMLQGAIEVDLNRDGDFADAQRIAGELAIRGVDIDTSPRRAIVDSAKCADCHERLELHGGHRVANVDGCVTCHNPNATDLAVRPATITDGTPANEFADFDAVGIDGKHETSIAMAEMVHRIHAGHSLADTSYTVYGFGRSTHAYGHVLYPRNLAECQACHLPGTAGLPLDPGALAITKLAAPDGATKTADLADGLDDANSGPSGAACGGCHDSVEALAHMAQARIDWTVGLAGGERDGCAVCHGPGESFDVEAVHAGE